MSISRSSSSKPLNLFGLVMINIIAIDNLRGLTMGAEYGLGLIVIYALVILFFLLPSALVTSELATGWPNTGGIYIWVREAFGPTTSFLVIWLQWIYNVIWYPTITLFIAGVVAYMIDPSLAHNKTYMILSTLTIFWLATLFNCFGMSLSGRVSTVSALLGTLFPMACIIVLGLFWLLGHYPIQINLSFKSLWPSVTHWSDLSLINAIVFALIGIEMSATHAADVSQPERTYPKAVLISSIIIVVSLILSSLAIAMVVPHDHLDILTGVVQGLDLFFKQFHVPHADKVLSVLIVIGSLGTMAAWIIGPSKGLMVSSLDGSLPACLSKQNSRGVPIAVLILQGVIVSLLSLSLLLLPTVSSSYWYLTDLTAQLALLSYVFFFAAAIRLRYSKAHIARHFAIPGGKYSVWLVGLLGIMSCVFAMGVGFVPPSQIDVGSTWLFELLLVAGMLLFTVPPVLLLLYNNYKGFSGRFD